MSKTIAGFTMSLDGFIAGPNDEVWPLFNWYTGGDTDFPLPGTDRTFRIAQASAEHLRDVWGTLGAIVTGRRDFDVSNAWGGRPPLGVPTFIVTHSPPADWLTPGSPFTFVTDGVEAALTLAKKAAGGKNVGISGTTIVQQMLNARLLDEIHIELAAVLLGQGIRLFDHLRVAPVDLEIIDVIKGMGVTHLMYRVRK